MKKWKVIHREGVGAFGYEIYQNTKDETRYLIKVFIYETPVILSGNKEILGNKISELLEVFKNLSEIFPNEEIPF